MLTDEIAHVRGTVDRITTEAEFAADLKAIADHCHWTEGMWPFPDGPRVWNAMDYTGRDIARMLEFLIGRYRQRVGGRR